MLNYGIPIFGSFYYRVSKLSNKAIQTWSLTEHKSSIMPKKIHHLYTSAQIIISNAYTFIYSFGRSSTAIALVIALVITSLWAHTSQAEAPFLSSNETINEVIVDGLTTTERAEKIDAFYISKGNLPLAGYGLAMVQYADEYELDWRLVASIGFIESTGGKFACKSVSYSAFGWGSCKISFSSYEESIETITKNLGGHNPNTARYYAGKDITGILDAYNPAHIRPNYKKMVTKAMDEITKIDAPTVLVKK